jgi:hypothetical protein
MVPLLLYLVVIFARDKRVDGVSPVKIDGDSLPEARITKQDIPIGVLQMLSTI